MPEAAGTPRTRTAVFVGTLETYDFILESKKGEKSMNYVTKYKIKMFNSFIKLHAPCKRVSKRSVYIYINICM